MDRPDLRRRAIQLIGILALATSFQTSKRKTWARKWILRRKNLGCFDNLMRELAFEDPEGYRRFMRMDVSSFEEILKKISPVISKRDTVMRRSIPAAERLAITLRFLATGETLSSLHYQFRIGVSTICGIVMEVCSAIYNGLGPDYLRTPSTTDEWMEVAHLFWTLWNFPNCIGAMDGKHVRINPPPNSGSVFYNYKGDFSIVLLALVDASLKFIYVDVGTNGRISDGGVWDKCDFREAMLSNRINKPDATSLPGTQVRVPYVIVADDAFPLTTAIMKPYPGRGIQHEERIFNYRLSRARRVSENAFGILATRFRIFHTAIMASPVKARMYVLASCCLHNFLRTQALTREGMSSEEGLNLMQELEQSNWQSQAAAFVPLRRRVSRGNQHAKVVRNNLCSFFNSTGSVSFQERLCNTH